MRTVKRQRPTFNAEPYDSEGDKLDVEGWHWALSIESYSGQESGTASSCDVYTMMNPDEPTPAMQNPEKNPEDWSTGDEPMTGPQRSYLQTLCREAGEEFNENWTKAEASKKIEELQQKTGRGKSGTANS